MLGHERPDKKNLNLSFLKGNLMRDDRKIKQDVEDELRWDPDIDATDIAVAVKGGVVTLTGFVRSYNEKLEAEVASKRVQVFMRSPTILTYDCRASRKDLIRKSRVMLLPQSRRSCRALGRMSRLS